VIVHDYIFTLKLVRCFSIGFTIFSPHYNGWLRAEISLACFILHFDSKGSRWFGFENHWKWLWI